MVIKCFVWCVTDLELLSEDKCEITTHVFLKNLWYLIFQHNVGAWFSCFKRQCHLKHKVVPAEIFFLPQTFKHTSNTLFYITKIRSFSHWVSHGSTRIHKLKCTVMCVFRKYHFWILVNIFLFLWNTVYCLCFPRNDKIAVNLLRRLAWEWTHWARNADWDILFQKTHFWDYRLYSFFILPLYHL